MTGSELRRRLKALDNKHTEQDAAWPSRGWRRVVARRTSQPVIGRGTLARVSGFASLAVTLYVGLAEQRGRTSPGPSAGSQRRPTHRRSGGRQARASSPWTGRRRDRDFFSA